jgi:hypothetical protein
VTSYSAMRGRSLDAREPLWDEAPGDEGAGVSAR